jgi:hypothetical protein
MEPERQKTGFRQKTPPSTAGPAVLLGLTKEGKTPIFPPGPAKVQKESIRIKGDCMAAKRAFIFAFVAAIVLTTHGQDITITGTVIDDSGNVVFGATVSLVSAGISTTSGAGGAFALVKSAVYSPLPHHAAVASAYIAGGAVRFFVPGPAPVKIELYSMSGRLVSTALNRTLEKGAYSLALMADQLRTGVYFIKIQIGEWSAAYRISLFGSATAAAGLKTLAGVQGRSPAKNSAVADTLVASKPGYTAFKKFVSSYTLSNQVCVISLVRACTNPSFNTGDPNGGWSNGGYYVHNNMWNCGSYACAETLYACSYHNWYVVANTNNNSGDGAVKTYPNVHKDYNNVAISTFDTITSSFAASSPHVGIYNVAYDIWTNGVATPGCTEFMIWTENYNQVPAGSLAATATLGGRTYNVWKTSSGGYIAFVPAAVFTSGTIDLLEIFKWTMSKGWLPANSTVGQICFGVEIVSTNSTKATFKFTDFSITAN